VGDLAAEVGDPGPGGGLVAPKRAKKRTLGKSPRGAAEDPELTFTYQ